MTARRLCARSGRSSTVFCRRDRAGNGPVPRSMLAFPREGMSKKLRLTSKNVELKPLRSQRQRIPARGDPFSAA